MTATAPSTSTETAGSEPAPAVELIDIDKRFGAVHANRDVSIKIAKGTIHGIVGENGAGKSTLMSILYGFYEADRGAIRINGTPTRIRSSKGAIAAGTEGWTGPSSRERTEPISGHPPCGCPRNVRPVTHW